nr:MAG TPA: hypothetical protein [Caudoviricetes sp.]
MAKFFTFAGRAIPVQFFEEDPIQVTLIASDEMDAKILDASNLIMDGSKEATLEGRNAKYRRAVDILIRHDIAEKILARSNNADGYALLSLYNGIVRAYGEGKAKNLAASH